MSPTRRTRWLLRSLLVALSTALLLALWAFVAEPASLRVREYTLALPQWPAQRTGLRVALLSDLHVGSPHFGLEKVREVVRRTNAARPDLVLIAGDLVTEASPGEHFVPPEAIAPVLKELSAPLGVMAVLGNHDWWLDAPRVQRALEGAGITVLEDRALRISDGGAPFWVVGVSDLWEGRHDLEGALAQVTDEAPVLVLTHNPDLFPEVPARVSLTLAGHTHGGQVYIPLLGRPIVPSRYKERFAQGHVVEDARHLFVSSGLGTSMLGVRFLVPPEISLLQLVPEQRPPPPGR